MALSNYGRDAARFAQTDRHCRDRGAEKSRVAFASPQRPSLGEVRAVWRENVVYGIVALRFRLVSVHEKSGLSLSRVLAR